MTYITVPCVFDCHVVVALSTQVHYGDQIFEPVNPRTLHTFDCCDVIQVTPTCQVTSQLIFLWQHPLFSFFLRCNDSGPTNCCCFIDFWSHVFNIPPSVSKDVASNCQNIFFFGVLLIFLWVVTCGTKPWTSSHSVTPLTYIILRLLTGQVALLKKIIFGQYANRVTHIHWFWPYLTSQPRWDDWILNLRMNRLIFSPPEKSHVGENVVEED